MLPRAFHNVAKTFYRVWMSIWQTHLPFEGLPTYTQIFKTQKKIFDRTVKHPNDIVWKRQTVEQIFPTLNLTGNSSIHVRDFFSHIEATEICHVTA